MKNTLLKTAVLSGLLVLSACGEPDAKDENLQQPTEPEVPMSAEPAEPTGVMNAEPVVLESGETSATSSTQNAN